MFWDFIACFVVMLASLGIIVLIEVIFQVSREQMMWDVDECRLGKSLGSCLCIVAPDSGEYCLLCSVVESLPLPTQADVRRRLGIGAWFPQFIFSIFYTNDQWIATSSAIHWKLYKTCNWKAVGVSDAIDISTLSFASSIRQGFVTNQSLLTMRQWV